MNYLYYGDNLDVMRRYLADESVDLVYLDPPFNSGRDYNAIYSEGEGDGEGKSKAQIQAFTDTWTWDVKAALAYADILKAGGKLAEAMTAFKALLGDGARLAYLSMMAPRLVEIRRVMKATGSVYLHCDPTCSHYLKILMDAVFGQGNFRNEIVWCYDTAGRSTHSWNSKHDNIIWYSKGKEYTFNALRVPRRNLTEGWKNWYPHVDTDGRKYQIDGKGYKYYADAGRLANDWWDDLPALHANKDKERLGYPTQKPVALLDRIIRASSNPGDTILDPFCGCGTTIDATQALGDRNWIGIDITHLAVGVMKKRLADRYGEAIADTYQVIGEPTDFDGARQLASEDTHQFEHWALGLVGARASAKGKGSDKGIDGILRMEEGGQTKTVPISVKSGKVNSGMIRDLRGVMERDKSPIGIFISLLEPTKDMRTEALAAGFYDAQGIGGLFGDNSQVPRIQILSIKELFAGATVRIPGLADNRTFKRAKP